MYTNGHQMNGNGAGRRNGTSRNGHNNNSLEAQFFSPFGGLQLMDNFFGVPMNNGGGGGFSSFSTLSSFGAMNGGGGGGGANGAVKRTSTSTTFVNGKKLVTKR